jgi:hypothetical protein
LYLPFVRFKKTNVITLCAGGIGPVLQKSGGGAASVDASAAASVGALPSLGVPASAGGDPPLLLLLEHATSASATKV